jgi:flagellar biosynthetic protein FliQ
VRPEEILDLLQLAMWTVAVISGPPIVGAMVVGTVIALLQALTQVQEATLTFVPKIVVVLLAVFLSSTVIGAALGKLTEAAYSRIESPSR